MLPAKLLEREGWRQGKLGDSMSGRCVLGAMIDGHQIPGLTFRLRELTGNQAMPLARWNDQPGQTAAHVIVMLRMAEEDVLSPCQHVPALALAPGIAMPVEEWTWPRRLTLEDAQGMSSKLLHDYVMALAKVNTCDRCGGSMSRGLCVSCGWTGQ